MQVSKLPPSWCMTSIGEFCNLINGRAFKSTEWTDKGLPIIRIQNLNNPDANFNFFNGELDSKHRVEKGDLLFAWSGTPGTSFGAHIWNGDVGALNQHIFKVMFNESLIDKRFIQYAINQTLDELISGAHGGVGLRHVTKGMFETTEIMFPPLAEQKIIADKLNALLTQVAKIKIRLESTLDILKTSRQSILMAGVSGKLTEEWRNITLVHWKKLKLLDVIQGKPRNGHSPKGVAYETPYRNLTLSATTSGKFIENQYKYIDLNIDSDSYLWVRQGDILIQRANSIDYVGVSAIYEGQDNQYVYPDLMMKCTPNPEKVLGKYLHLVLSSQKVRKYFRENATGTSGNMPKINQQVVSNTPISLPPLDEQQEILRRIKEFFTLTDHIEQQVNAALARINNLTQSILAKAFRGELTADWRDANPELISDDNSAEALLKKIKTDRETIERKPKPKRSTIKKKTDNLMSKQIIKVTEALKQAGKPLSGQQLLAAAGYPSDSDTEQLEQFFLDIRNALTIEKSIVKLERGDDGQDWFTLSKTLINKEKN